MIYISWNINGIRATLKTHQLHDLIHTYKPDFLCLQEVKATIEQVDPKNIEIFADYPHIYWNSPIEKKGYSGGQPCPPHTPSGKPHFVRYMPRFAQYTTRFARFAGLFSLY